MTDRSDFKKASRPNPKPFQVSLDFTSGLKIGLGFALAQLLVALGQLAAGWLVTYLMLH